MSWDELEFWRSPQWAGIQEKLDALDQSGIPYNPDRVNLFTALDTTSLDSVKVAIIGQDPYPQSKFCTGIAFSIPIGMKTWPATLVSIFEVYQKDLHYPIPTSGDLTKWCEQG